MRNCPFCEEQIPSTSHICPNCGSALSRAPQAETIGPSPYRATMGNVVNPPSAPRNPPSAPGWPPDGATIPESMNTPSYNATSPGGASPYNHAVSSYSRAQQPSYSLPSPYYGTTGSPGQRREHSSLSRGMVALLVLLALLAMLSGAALILYAGVVQPAQLHSEATATVQSIQNANVHVSSTIQAQATTVAAATVTGQVQATAQALATATVVQSLYTNSTGGTPALDETLAGQNVSNWDIYNATGGGGCAFVGGALQASVSQSHFYVPCFAHATSFGNFAFEAQMSILKGDEGGLIFRADDTTSQFYVFRVGLDGNYSLYISKDDKNSTPLADDSSSSINTTAGQINTLTVIAQNNTISMFINKQFVSSASDGTYKMGEIGVFAGDNTNTTEVAFSNVRIWNL